MLHKSIPSIAIPTSVFRALTSAFKRLKLYRVDGTILSPTLQPLRAEISHSHDATKETFRMLHKPHTLDCNPNERLLNTSDLLVIWVEFSIKTLIHQSRRWRGSKTSTEKTHNRSHKPLQQKFLMLHKPTPSIAIELLHFPAHNSSCCSIMGTSNQLRPTNSQVRQRSMLEEPISTSQNKLYLVSKNS